MSGLLPIFTTLPDEFLVDILSFLDIDAIYLEISRINLRLSVLVTQPHFWKTLNLTPLRFHVEDTVIAQLAPSWSRLSVLDLSQCSQLRDASLVSLSQFCPNLLEICLFRCYRITDDGIRFLVQGCPRLEMVNLQDVTLLTDTALQALGQLRNLRGLNVVFCRNLTDHGIEQLVCQQPELLALDVSDCVLMSDSMLRALNRHCTRLHSLGAGRCSHLTGEGLLEFVRAHPRLQLLHLDNILTVRDWMLAELANCCASTIQSLHVSGCYGITDDGIQFIAEHCPELVDLDVSDCDALTDSALNFLRRCTKLTELNLKGCLQLTQVGLLPLCQRLPPCTLR
eukprot:TRINITY_DN16497_c0_g2_i2.p1 TRINITY_DN16497_c0_g2~~TRINITY_DN16497_c0_g2_i2.p1  ORF type:complete len:339 (-),score=6.47 TRINITY_DN16497_c0_g2_i2:9-1025(-)